MCFLYHRYKASSMKYILKKSLVIQKLLHTFAVHKELRSHVAGRRVKRESGANPEQFLLLCISTPNMELCLLHSLPLVKYWEGATSEMSQKTYLCI